jgi:hypothetical protein
MEVMATMDATGNRWNDDRLDEFARNVDKRFDQVDKRFDRLDQRMEAGFNRVNDRLDDPVKVLIAGIITLTGAILAGFAAILVLVATQL